MLCEECRSNEANFTVSVVTGEETTVRHLCADCMSRMNSDLMRGNVRSLLSTVLDVLCFLVLWYAFRFNNTAAAGYFQCGWFMFGVISQTMVIHTIRTPKLPFIQDRASRQLTFQACSS